ncbi:MULTISPECIES: hypothetical protein [Pseudomonas syringae group]|nr:MULTISPECIES: hypothetical protein [Pseudomonas syringae group]KWS67546.1 hypothetical protein AL055_19390 [Pseudomonas amygdali pv. morsprunorum]PHN46202.1 hypothetical protein AO261_16090 [Pseudomonas avellanae]POC91469.1 hypothetical protein BKM26_14955 [Pseudomonas avellanae]POD07814.1 hypothetical protein BKM20_14830 [Pseudomonas avellanae]POD20656.1 hypothetical protein BKM05_19030 [Pseudomonas avellanae]
MEESTPEKMRFWKEVAKEKEGKKTAGTHVPALHEEVELYNKRDHEHFRFASLPRWSQFWLISLQLGKGGFIVLSPFIVLAHLSLLSVSHKPWLTVTVDLLLGAYPLYLGSPLLLWLVCRVVIYHFPHVWFRRPKGPDWELNRRTGLVTIYDYKRHRKEGVIDEFVAPFYEFDAYMTTTNNRHGPTYGLLLQHRYENRKINFHMLINADDFQQRPCALWDFLQNYMDTSGPIPDIPLFEPYRHLDPVTARYDQQRGRNPRYWIDMDDATFKAEVEAMWQRVYAINTFSRPNLMARYVDYES